MRGGSTSIVECKRGGFSVPLAPFGERGNCRDLSGESYSLAWADGIISVMRQVIIYPDLEDGGWVSEVPSLPGCFSQGETREEALHNAREAIEEWLAAAKAVELDVPPETFGVQVCVVESA
jgi:predicted RNase H-like HicB family nuclease